MQKNLVFLFLISLQLSLFAQKDPHFVVFDAIYDSEFNTLSWKHEEKIAKRLFKFNLETMLDSGILNRTEMRDLALPLGIHNTENNSKIDFQKGMEAMWQAKEGFITKRLKKTVTQGVIDKKNHFISLIKQGTTKLSVTDYRANIITPATLKTQELHKKNRENFSSDKQKFMDLIVKNLSPNVMLAYNIQELLPTTYWHEKKVKTINPLFKIYYFDLLLQKGGLEYIEGFPARYDQFVSYGPFQITNFAVKHGILANPRLIDEFKIHKSIEELQNVKEHAEVAAFNSYNNWEIMAFVLEKRGHIKKFNEYFANYKYDTNKRNSLRLFIAGITSCMHHEPTSVINLVEKYIKKHTDLSNIHYKILTETNMKKYLKQYYRSSAEAYLLMKVYHKFQALAE